MRTALYSPLNARLSEIMKSARLDAGITQVERARATGRTQAYISKFERGQLRFDLTLEVPSTQQNCVRFIA